MITNSGNMITSMVNHRCHLLVQNRLQGENCDQSRFYSSDKQQAKSSFVRYFRSLKWSPIPLGLGFAYLCYQQYGQVKKREIKKLDGTVKPKLATDVEINLIKLIPFNQISRLTGWLSETELPMWIRRHFFSWYIKKYDCNMDEALEPDHMKYSSFQNFFRRHLKPGVRIIDTSSPLTSPSDGTCLYFGEVRNDVIEQVKGITYSIEEFLGPDTWNDNEGEESQSFAAKLLKNKGNTLYHCVIYLNPGNYHRFHSPADWIVQYRRHFPGELFSTMPSFVQWIKGLYCMNERVVTVGKWKYGFFAMVPVGATNVGSIQLTFDETLETNQMMKSKSYSQDFRSKDSKEGIKLEKGEAFGEFKLGSTIVMVFEGPKNMQFKIHPNQNLKYGQAILTS